MKKEEITVKIKTFEDAMKATGRPNVPDFSNLPTDLQVYFTAQYKIIVIIEALNEGWEPDWSNSNQKKWYPWFRLSGGGFVFNDTTYGYSYAIAGNGSRLCLKSDELATYAGTQFSPLWIAIIQK